MERNPRRLPIATLVAGAVALGAVLAPVAAAIDWRLPAEVISGAGVDAESPDTPAALVDGGALHVFRVRERADNFRVGVRRMEPSGALGTTRIVSAPGLAVFQPEVAADPRGGAVAIWAVDGGPGSDSLGQLVRVAPDGSPVGEVVTFASAPAVVRPRAVVAADGTIIAAWAEGPGGGTDRVRARQIPPAGPPGATVDLSPLGALVAAPAVVLGTDGVATIAWDEEFAVPGGGFRVALRRLGPTGPPAPRIEPVAGDRLGQDPAIAPGLAGATHVVWVQRDGPLADPTIAHRVVDASGAGVSDATVISASEIAAGLPVIAARPGGGVVAGWLEPSQPAVSASNPRAVLRPIGAGGELGAPAPVSPGAFAQSDLRLAGSPDGSAVAIWVESALGFGTVAAVRLRPAGTLGEVEAISPSADIGDNLGVAVLRDGRVVAAWEAFGPEPPPPGLPAGEVQAAIAAPTLFVPGAPNGVSGTDLAGQARITWSAPASDGGLPIFSSTATASPGGASCVALAGATACTIAGLPTGVAHTVTVVARNSLGDGAPSAPSAPFTIPPPPVVGPPDPPIGPLPPVPVAPRISAATITPARALRGVPARTTRTVRIRVALTAAARLQIRFDRRLPGLRRGARCVAPTPALRRAGARPCVRFVGAGVIRRTAPARTHTVALTRLRVGGRVLPVGRYRVSLIATVPGVPAARAVRQLVVAPAPRPIARRA